MITLIILMFASFALVDLLDKFLLGRQKIEPVSYNFYTITTGALLLLAWPLVYEPLPLKFIGLDLLSGAYFSLMMFVFFKALSKTAVSHAVPLVFGLVPVFDLVFGFFIGRGHLLTKELAAVSLLIPGALLLAHYHEKKIISSSNGLLILAAAMVSSYNYFWQYSAQVSSSLNNLMWNRIGAAGILLLCLLWPVFRKKVFAVRKLPQRKKVSLLFLGKQALGGLNFVVLSHFLVVSKVSIVDSLATFRYAFVILAAWILGGRFRQFRGDRPGAGETWIKIAGLALIILGTVILYLK